MYILTRISFLSVAIISTALIVLLSAFNGIENIIEEMYSNFDPDITISHNTKKSFYDKEFNYSLLSNPEIQTYSRGIEQIVVLKNKDKPIWGKLMGVEKSYLDMIDLQENLVYEKASLNSLGELFEEMKSSVLVGPEITEKINIDPKTTTLHLTAAKNRYNKMKPYKMVQTACVGVFNYNKETNENVILTSLEFARSLLDYEQKITHVYVDVKDKKKKENVKEKLQKELGNDFLVQTNVEKNELVFKTSRSEKSMLIIILIFIFILAAVNLIGSLVILFVQKKEEIQTLLSLGLTKNNIKRMFLFEGLIISFFGLLTGIFFGYFLYYLQIKFSIITIDNGQTAYPMFFKMQDVFLVFFLVLIVSGIFSWLTIRILGRSLS